MIKRIAVAILCVFNINASLPPTTLNGVTTFNFKAPNVTRVTGGGLIEDSGSSNLLSNPNFEGGTTGWTCTVGTCTSTSTSGEFSQGSSALKVALSTQAMNVSQAVTIAAGSITQHVVGVRYRVPSTMTDFQICTLVNGAEKTCVPSANLILNDTYQSIEIPEVATPSQTLGIKFKTTSSYTGNAFFDAAYVKAGIGSQNLQLDNVYSAQVSSTGVVSGENKDWINGNCVNSPTGVFTCTPVSGIFTTTPNCVTVNTEGNGGSGLISSFNVATSTASSLVFSTANAGTSANYKFSVICQKSGNDYLASSAAVYSQASANYDWTAYTPSFQGFGTPTSVECQHARDGGDLLVRCKFAAGTTTASEARIGLPSGLTSASSSVIPSIQVIGHGAVNVSASTYFSTEPLIEPGVTYITLGQQASTAASLTKINGNAFSSGNVLSFFARVPISGWSNSPVIVGSFEKIEKCANDYECTDTFTAKLSSTCVVSDENVPWISSTTNPATGNCAIVLRSGLVDGTNNITTAMTCNATVAPLADLPGASAFIIANSTTGLTTRVVQDNVSAYARAIHLRCSKTGSDFKPKTAKVATSIGVPTVPGITTTGTGNSIDTFSVSYGTTNATTACSASPCSYLDQIGTAVTSITRSGTGSYVLNTGKTYSKLKCTASTGGGGNNNIPSLSSMSCSSCSSLSFVTATSAANTDSYGVINCLGSY